MKTNKILVLLMALAMVLSMTAAFAADEYRVGDTWYCRTGVSDADTAYCVYAADATGDLTASEGGWVYGTDTTQKLTAADMGLKAPSCAQGTKAVFYNCLQHGDKCQKMAIVAVPAIAEHTYKTEALTAEEIAAGKYEAEKTATCTTPGTDWMKKYCTTCGTIEKVWLADVPAGAKHLELEKFLLDNYDYTEGKLLTVNDAKAIMTRFDKKLVWSTETNNDLAVANGEHWVLTYKAPTCKNGGKGSITFACKACDKKYTYSVAITGSGDHQLGLLNDIDWAKLTAAELTDPTWWAEVMKVADAVEFPTCEDAGWAMFECAICGEDVVETIPTFGHIYSAEGFVQYGKLQYNVATQDRKNQPDRCAPYTPVDVCLNPILKLNGDGSINLTFACKEYKVAGAEVPAAWSHTYPAEKIDNLVNAGRIEIVAGTDTRASLNCNVDKAVTVKCVDCGYQETITVAKAGHSWKEIDDVTSKNVQAQKCDQDGIVEVQCKNFENCRATNKVNIGKSAHTEIKTGSENRNCNTVTEGKVECAECGEVIRTWSIPKGHSFTKNAVAENMRWDEATKDWYIKDCTKPASIKGYCTKCEVEREDKFAAATAHTKPTKECKKTQLVNGKAPEGYYYVTKATCVNVGTEEWNCVACDQYQIITTDPMADHFTKIAKTIVIDAPTCQETGRVKEICGTCPDLANAQSREVDVKVADHDYTKLVDGKMVCKWCNKEKDLIDVHNFKVLSDNITMTENKTSGIGRIDLSDCDGTIGNLYARVNFNFKLANGEDVAYITCVEINKDGEFRMASPTAPIGATLTNVGVMITSDGQAHEKYITEVHNMGFTTLR